LQYAEQQARVISVQLDNGQFNWANWELNEAPKPETVSDWVEKFETEYWIRRSRNQQTETTWKKDYQVVFPKFVEFANNAEISIDLIIKFVDSFFNLIGVPYAVTKLRLYAEESPLIA
jgi:hypothetical protein